MFSKPHSPTDLFKIHSHFNPFSAVCKTSYPSSIIIVCIHSIRKGFTILPCYCRLQEIRYHYTHSLLLYEPYKNLVTSLTFHVLFLSPCKTLSPLTERTPVTVIRSQKTNTIYSSRRVVGGINANEDM